MLAQQRGIGSFLQLSDLKIGQPDDYLLNRKSIFIQFFFKLDEHVSINMQVFKMFFV